MRTIRPFIALTVLALALAACGAAASSPAQVGVDEAGRGLDSSGTAAGGPQAAPSAAPAKGDAYDASAIGPRDDSKIIRTGTIELEVSDVPQALRTARDAIVALGGYVGASNTSNTADRPTAQITYRIPADRWEDALDALRDLNGLTTKVATEQTEAIEVTGQVIDLQARIKNLRASETALQGIAARATKISDVLEVEARLSDVRGQIEQLTAQLEDLNDRASYATLTAYFSSPIVAVVAAGKDWEPAAAVDEAAASLISILQAVATAGIWFLIVWLPILLVLGLVGGLALWLSRRAGIGRRGGPGLPPPPSLPGERVTTQS
ncbi:MAG TPA: DUF4349 domain-containing protein [Candidatus Limnocylindrales bacterium]|nr:DUF4349 domain-containing protein [Candidatus Limnocylindrales bacterium]